MRGLSKHIMEEKQEIAKTKLEQRQAPAHEKDPAAQAIIQQREAEVQARQKVLEDMAEQVQAMAKDLSSMKNDYASNMLNTDEYAEKIKEMETKQQEKLVQAERKMEELMND